MKKTLLSLSIAAVCFLSAQSSAEPSSSDFYDLAINQLATDASPAGVSIGKAYMDQALAEGDGRAALRLGTLALQEAPTKGDEAYQQALAYFDRAVQLDAPGAKQEYAVATVKRGYFAGRDTPEGQAIFAQARPLLTQSVLDSKTPETLYQLGLLEVHGRGGTKDLIAGYDHILEAAEGGHGNAALWIADRFSGAIPRMPEVEAKYIRIAVRANTPGAEARLAALEDKSGYPMLTQNEQDPTQLPSAAVATAAPVTPPAMGGFTTAPATSSVNSLPASSMDNGEVVVLRRELESTRQQLAEARAQLDKLLHKSGGLSEHDLARINQEGIQAVLEGNYEVAVVRFRETVKYDYPSGLANLGILTMNGTGVPRDWRQAASLLERAAKKGNVVAAENLGRGYEFGLLYPDRSRAIKWYQTAAAMGSTQAADALARLRN